MRYPRCQIRWGTQTFPNRSFWWVDARDVVNAHIQAYEIREASGKYCSVLVCAIITSKWANAQMTNLMHHSSRCPKRKQRVYAFHFTPLEVC
ncbi:hypothetical protein AAG906_004774 [Vitis piasezkii]